MWILVFVVLSFHGCMGVGFRVMFVLLRFVMLGIYSLCS